MLSVSDEDVFKYDTVMRFSLHIITTVIILFNALGCSCCYRFILKSNKSF